MPRTITEELAIKIAGSKYAIETSQEVIKDWSPNNLRGIFIGSDERGVFVDALQYIGKECKRTYIPNEHRSRTIPALNLMFQRRKYSCLEFFCWDITISEVGLNPTKTLQYLVKYPLLSVVGGVSGVWEEAQMSKEDLVRSGAQQIEGVLGLEGVYFQPATYQLDAKIKDKLDRITSNLSNLFKVTNELSVENFQLLEFFEECISYMNNLSLDFNEQIRLAFNTTINSHKMGMERGELRKLLEDNPDLRNTDGFSLFTNILDLLDKCFNNGTVQSSQTVLRLLEFCLTWANALELEMKGVLGKKLLEGYLGLFEGLNNPIIKLRALLDFQENMGG